MYLSNERLLPVIFLLLPLWASGMVACSSTNKSSNPPATNIEPIPTGPPFATKEPDVYQAEAYVSSGDTSEKYFIARNRDERRFDTYANEKLAVTELIKDNNRYVIDHVRKLYYIEQSSDKGPKAVDPIALAIFQNTRHHEFDETGRDGDLVTYHAKKLAGDPDQDVVLTIDQKSGLIVRQEVKGADTRQSFTFELKNVKLETSDDLF